MYYFSKLKPKSYISVDTRALSDDGLVVLSRFGIDALAWCFEVADRIVDAIVIAVPTFSGEAAKSPVFMRGVRSSVLRALRMAGGEPDLDPITSEGADVARDFARRGLEVAELMKSHRIGVPVLAAAHIESAIEHLPAEAAAKEVERLSSLFFEWLEVFSDQMYQTYIEEFHAWQLSRDSESLALINAVLARRQVDTEQAKLTLNYNLEAEHIAVIAWSNSLSSTDGSQLIDAIGRELRAMGAIKTLILPVGVNEAWGWGQIPDGKFTPSSTTQSQISMAFGQAHSALSGFRRSHTEARNVQHLIRNSPTTDEIAACYAELELATILCSDLENARFFVRNVLGELAQSGERFETIRETLWLYLESERSISSVADQLYISRNTVTYRIRQAEQLMGCEISSNRLNIQAALLVSRKLSERVLTF